MSTGRPAARVPRFSIVTAVYDVEPYLPDFIASIEAQRFDLGRVEVIAVNDGSTDGSLAILEAWAKRRPELVRVLTQPNGGEGSARNLGLAHATGEWVTSTDPDDMLDPDFLLVADRFAAAHPEVEIMSGKAVLLEEGKGGVRDAHARRRQYAAGDRPVDLEVEPNVFPGVGAGSFLRVARIREHGLAYDPRIRPNFVDGHFLACYLLGMDRPIVGLLADAVYIYRKRASGDSALQRSLSHPGRYTDVLRFGYLDLLARARVRGGRVPPWLQHLLVYELSWYLSKDESPSSPGRIPPEVIPEFHELFRSVLAQLDPEVVRRHTARSLKPVWMDILADGCRDRGWHSPALVRTRVDRVMGLQRLVYRFAGTAPEEVCSIDGTVVKPAYSKTMSHDYLGRTLMSERILWLPVDGTVQVRIDGIESLVLDDWPRPAQVSGPKPSGRRRSRGRSSIGALARSVIRRGRRRVDRLYRQAMRAGARSRPFRSTFRDAWVLIDRVYTADDNAERLFEYLRAERPDINAWFVVEKGTPDWRRMRAAGVPRLVAYGSFRWKMLMLDCSWLVTSHADRAIAQPPQIMRIIDQPTWRYAFPQHGVTKDDLSQWLNRYDIDLFVVSTQAEFESITADGTCYAFTAKETRKTGLPRFDRLLAKGREVGPDDRDLILVAPTWRTYLTLPGDPTTQRRAIDEGFWDSAYLRAWTGILRSPEVATAAAQRGLTVAFMPHPNIQPVLPRMDLPPHILPLTFADQDVQGLYARCALLVTDYSSVAFNTAYIDRPVVYYQFDRDDVMRGAHLGRKGYFDYERDGFGPVALDEAAAIQAVVQAIEHGPRPTPEYQVRIDRTFTDRDGQACARVVAAIEEMSRPYRAPDVTSTP